MPKVKGNDMSQFKSPFLSHLHHAYYQTDASYAWPNSREGDMLRQAKREIEGLQMTILQLQNKYNDMRIEQDSERDKPWGSNFWNML